MDDDRVNQLVQQWLNERGYQVALLSLQQESGVQVEDIASGGQLCSMLYELAELKAMLEPVTTGGLEAERKVLVLHGSGVLSHPARCCRPPQAGCRSRAARGRR